jgi:hypothetical protein
LANRRHWVVHILLPEAAQAGLGGPAILRRMEALASVSTQLDAKDAALAKHAEALREALAVGAG